MVYSGILILNAVINLGALFALMTVQQVAQQDDAAAQTSMEEVHKITTADYLVSSVDVAIFLACGIGFFLRQGWMVKGRWGQVLYLNIGNNGGQTPAYRQRSPGFFT